MLTWKDKILDYEIETRQPGRHRGYCITWKDKILDYEIETWSSIFSTSASPDLEKIRFSITRLKQWSGRMQQHIGNLTWKDKILDYEIETLLYAPVDRQSEVTWKDKILDYEIETIHLLLVVKVRLLILKR